MAMNNYHAYMSLFPRDPLHILWYSYALRSSISQTMAQMLSIVWGFFNYDPGILDAYSFYKSWKWYAWPLKLTWLQFSIEGF